MSDVLSEDDKKRLLLAQEICRLMDLILKMNCDALGHAMSATYLGPTFAVEDARERMSAELFLVWQKAEIDSLIVEKNLQGFIKSPWPRE